MRVFVTGAHGFIGQATVRELIQHGHKVLGLVRNDEQAEAMKEIGAEPHKGNLTDIESLKSGVKATDGVIHLAFVHDFQSLDFAASCATDRAAIEAMGEVLAGTGNPFVIASGTLDNPKGILTTEDTEAVQDNPPHSDRALSAALIYALSKEKQVRGSVVRLPPIVHGTGDWGFIPMITNIARQKGHFTYIAGGSTRWPAVHRDDAAVMLRLALEKGTAGATYHAVAEQGLAQKDIWTTVGKRLQLPVKSQSLEEALPTMGFFAHVISMDNPTSSEKTKKELGWQPVQMELLPDLETNYSF